MTTSWLALLALTACRTEFVPPVFLEPTLILQDPSAGDWKSLEPVQAYGIAENLGDVTVNDEPVALDAGSFTREIQLVRGMNVIEARGVDGRGDTHYVRHGVLAGSFRSPGFAVQDAAVVRLNTGAIDLMMSKASGWVDETLVDDSLSAANPVFETTYAPGGGELATVMVDVANVDFDYVVITAEPKSGRMDLVIEVRDLWVDLDVYGELVGAPFLLTADMWSDTALITGAAHLGVTDRGKLDVTLNSVGVSLEGFGFDTSALGDFEAGLPMEDIRRLLEDKLAETMITELPPILEDQLQLLDLSYDMELLGEKLSANASFGRATVDPDGVELGVDVDVEVQANADYFYLGSLVADGLDPDLSRGVDVAAVISDDLLNRMLFEVWKGGLLDQTLSTADGSLDPAALALLGVEEGAVHVEASLPPVVVQNELGLLEAQVAELLVHLDAPGSSLGDSIDVAVFATIDLQPQAVNNVLRLATGEPEVVVQVRASSGGVSNETMTALLEEVLPLEVVLSLIQGVEIPIPSLADVQVVYVGVSRDAGGASTDLEMTLE